MSQINLLILELVLCLTMIIVLYKKYSKLGIYIYCITAMTLASIMSLKTITLYNYDINLGIIPLVTIYTASNILIQKQGKDESKNILIITLLSFIVGYILLYLTSIMKSSNINLFTSASYDNIFAESIKIYFATLVSTLYSLLLNMNLYYYLKKIKNSIIISNIFSSIIIQFISSIIFGLISNIFVKDAIDIIKIIMIRYLMSLAIAIISTIVIYISNLIKDKE